MVEIGGKYYCKGGKYTTDCLVEVVDTFGGSCHIRIVKSFPSINREGYAEVGRVWDGQIGWLSEPKGIDCSINPNFSFLLQKRSKRR